MEVALATLVEEFVCCILRCILNLGFLELLLDLIVNLLFIFGVEERSQFTYVQDIVNVLDECFLLYVLVRE